MDFSKMWNIVPEENNEAEQSQHEYAAIADNVTGFVITEEGRIVAKFGFFANEEITGDEVAIKISKNGFLSKIYKEQVNLIIGYGAELKLPALVDLEKTQVLNLGPDQLEAEEFQINIPIDEDLTERGVILIIRDADVIVENLPSEILNDYMSVLDEAKSDTDELSPMEASYANYLKHLSKILSGEIKPELVEASE